jgi:hypothetical protein
MRQVRVTRRTFEAVIEMLSGLVGSNTLALVDNFLFNHTRLCQSLLAFLTKKITHSFTFFVPFTFLPGRFQRH